MSNIIGLHALPRAGKDTLASILTQDHGYTQLSFGGAVYEEVSHAYGVSIDLLQSDHWKRNAVASLALRNCDDPDFVRLIKSQGIAEDEPLSSRQVLQFWGTEYRRRTVSENYWVDRLDDKLTSLYWEGARFFVISDVRAIAGDDGEAQFNEAEFLQEFARLNGWRHSLVEIVREGTNSNGHGSDLRFPQESITRTITNDGSPGDMLDQIRDLI